MTPEQQKALAIARAKRNRAEAMLESVSPEENPKRLEDVYSLDKPFESAGNLVGAALEPAMQIGSGMVASSIGGLSGIGTELGNTLGLDLGDSTENIEYFQDAMTYQPRSTGGQVASEALMAPFEKLEEGAETVGQANLDITGSPAIGAAAKTTIMSLPAIIGAKGAKKAMPPEAVPSALAETVAKPVTAPLNAAGATLKFVKDALVNRLPKGAERATVDTIDKMLGDRFPKVVELLRTAKEGQTAGQAATKAESMEFSALQKFAEQIDPSGFQAMLKAQRADRLQSLSKGFGETPKALALAKSRLVKESEANYAKSRNDAIDPRSNVQVLEAAKQKGAAGELAAREAKINALKDKGIMDTMSAQQANMARGDAPIKGKLQDMSNRPGARYDDPAFTKELLSEKNLPNFLQEQAGIPDSMVAPKTSGLPNMLKKQAGVDYTVPPAGKNLGAANHFRANDAKIAAAEIKNIAKERAVAEKTYNSIQKVFEQNKVGEKGPSLSEFLDRPSIQRGIRKAKELAAEGGAKLPDDINKWKVKDLQLLKQAVADEMSVRLTKEAGASGLGPKEAAKITSTKKAFTDFIRSKSKKFAAAEDAYARGAKPISQMESGQALSKGLGEETLLPQSRKGIEAAWDKLEKQGKTRDLTDTQKSSVDKITDAMMNDEILKYQSGKGYPALNKEMGAVLGDLPNPLDRRIMIIKAILKRIEGKNTKDTNALLSDKMKKPNEMADLMEMVINKRKRKADIKKIKNPAIVGAGILEAENE